MVGSCIVPIGFVPLFRLFLFRQTAPLVRLAATRMENSRRIQPGNRLGFVKVKSIGENRSSTYRKKGKNLRTERTAEEASILGGSLSCCRLCARHPDSIPSFFS